MPYIYVIGAAGHRAVKIGHSATPRTRIATMQVGSPVKLSLLLREEVEDAEEVEARLHEYFARHRVRGEWFDLGPDPVGRVKRAIILCQSPDFPSLSSFGKAIDRLSDKERLDLIRAILAIRNREDPG